MSLRASLPLVSTILLVACGVQTSTGSSSSGAGGSTSSSTSSGSTSSTTTSSSTTSSGTTTSSSSSTGSSSGDGGCTTGSIELVLDFGAPETLSSACMGSWNPKNVPGAEGYVIAGGPPPGGYDLFVVGCASNAAVSEGLLLEASAMTPGTYTTGMVQYTDPGGSQWAYPIGPFKITYTKLGMVGDTIEGTFAATVTHVMNGNAAHQLEGSFVVCHQPDELLP
jgi:hypothetical protein